LSTHDEIRKAYGAQALQSAPVDLENPSFASLLSAFQAVHAGELAPSTLQTYYAALTRELEESRRSVQETSSGHPLQLTLTTLDLAQAALDAIPEYFAAPSNETMGECVQRFLVAHNAMAQLNWYLDQHEPE
jgi:hypothetical protein